MAASKLIAQFIKSAMNKGKRPNFGVLKTRLEKKVREGIATKEDKKALTELRQKDTSATKSQKVRQSQSSRKTPVSLPGSEKVGGTQTKLQRGLASVKDTPTPKVKKPTKKPTSAAKKKRMEEAKKKGSGALLREGLSDIIGKKAVGGKMKSKGYAAGGKMKSKGYAAGGKMKTKGYKAGGKTCRGMGVALRGGGAVSKS